MKYDNQDSVMFRQIKGALWATINAHGRIDSNLVQSAAKRILGHLKKFKNNFPDNVLKERLLDTQVREHQRLQALRGKLDRATDPHRKSHIAGKCSEKRRQLIQIGLLLRNFGPDAKVITETHGDRETVAFVVGK
jgi:hypothetical protein